MPSKAVRPQLKANRSHESDESPSTVLSSKSRKADCPTTARRSACKHTSACSLSLATSVLSLTSLIRGWWQSQSSSISWRHCYFSFLPDSSPLAFDTVSLLLPRLLRQSFSGQLSGPSSPYSTQHMVQMVQLYNRWAGALRHILLEGLGDSLIQWSLNSYNRF